MLTGFVLTIATVTFADTLYLKNGAAIDGIVTGRHDGNIVLNIGNVGTIKIPIPEVERVEKNARTGYLDPNRGKKESRPKLLPEVEKAEEEQKRAEKDKKDGSDKDKSKSKAETTDKLDPEVEKKIRELAFELTRQRTQNRVRAERKLREYGDLALPELLKLTDHEFVRTRAAVFRLFSETKDFRVVDPSVRALEDSDRFVRKLAWETLKNVSGKKYSFPWDGSERQRLAAGKKWVDWYLEEKEAREKAAQAKADKEKAKAAEEEARN